MNICLFVQSFLCYVSTTQLSESKKEINKKVHNGFIDLENIFDNVNGKGFGGKAWGKASWGEWEKLVDSKVCSKPIR